MITTSQDTLSYARYLTTVYEFLAT